METIIRDLKKSYNNTTALNVADFRISDGGVIGLAGNNGAGKTTLFRLMLDLIKADCGSVQIDGTDVARSEAWKEKVGAYIDDSFLIDYLTPEEYFHFIGKICGIDKQTVDERITRFSHFLGEEILSASKLIRNLSAGNKQKTGIVAALLHNPQLVLLDEPFNFLDPSSQVALKHLIKDYNQSTGATIIISSHNLSQTTELCERIILLEHGIIIKDIDNSDGTAKSELDYYFGE